MALPRSLLPVLASIAILSWLTSCTQPGSVSPAFEVVPHKPETAIAYRIEGDAVIFDIFSRNGIGGANVALTAGKMPRQMLLRLHLKGLESLQFSYPETTDSSDRVGSVDTTVSLAVSYSGTEDVRIVQGGGGAQETSLTPDSPYWMDVNIVAPDASAASIPLENGYFEVTPPSDFLQGDQREFSLEWVDFYR